jgi:propanol-preferring alcohol dehydrogenase
MKAYQLVQWQAPPQLRDVPVPEPEPGQVLIKVAGAGACHSDLHLMQWPEGVMPFRLPFTLGHENAGWVEALGAGVEGWAEGDAVVVYGPWGCGRCRECRQSRETLCERRDELRASGGGLGLDGGMAEYMLVPDSRLLLALGDLDPREAAPLTDAALTPYHAIKRSMHLLHPGSTAVVIGVGGLGHMAVQILKALTPARIIAVDVSTDKLELAREVGADEAIESDVQTARAVRELTAGLGAQVVLDFVGADSTMALAAASVRPGGDIEIVGIGGGSLSFAFGVVPLDATVSIPYWGTAVELLEVLELAQRGAIRAHVERFPLDRVEDAYARMREGSLTGRAVICPHG